MRNFILKKRNKSFSLIIIIILQFILFQDVKSQNIPADFFGQNAWMPVSIGSTIYNGKLDSQWNKVKDSKAQIIRYGGNSADKEMPTHEQYLSIIDSITNNGMEPIIQVPFYNNKYSATQAADLVEFINITSGKKIKYWIIGNEPDNSYGYSNSAQVANYIKTFSYAMKKKDPSIKIIAPETAWYNQNILDGLTTPGGVSDITGKDNLGNFIVDMISFHLFAFSGDQTRSEVISYLSGPGHFEENLSQLNLRVAACNIYHQRDSISHLGIAFTEGNIDWENPSGDGIFGLGANSFLGGQFTAEMIGVCMKKNVNFINFWSIIEGSELGYLYHTSTLPKPTYYHFQMLADNFKGVYCNGKVNNTNIKSFGSKKNSLISVIILNEGQSNDYNYTLRLDTNLISGTNPLKININAGTPIEFSDTVYRESSVLLTLNTSGKLIKKCVYKLRGNADMDIPPTCSIDASLLQVKIISPANGSSFYIDSAITIQASASGGEGPIQKVEFFADSIKLGESLTKPYSFTWQNAAVGLHALTVKVTDSLNNTAVSSKINISVTLIPVCRASGFISREVWNNISGTSVSSIPVNSAPGTKGELSIFEAPTNYANNYGQRIRGYICPPAAGNYTFWIASDDNSELWLSTNDNPANKVRIALVTGLTTSRQWTKYSSQKSALKYLIAGQKYYIEALHKEGTQNDNCAVGWQLPNGTLERPIPGSRLSQYAVPIIINITSPINNSSFTAGSNITFQVTASGGTGIFQKVEFFDGSVKLGEDLTSPYSFILNNAPAGIHSITAKATDSGNNTAISAIVNISVNALPLIAAITSPVNNASFSIGSSITIQVNASGGTGTIQKVEFYADTTKLGEDLTSPYTFTWNNVSQGNYGLTAKVTDGINGTAVSAKINISVIPIVACSSTGTIIREVWNNITGTSVSLIPLTITPSSTGFLNIFEAPSNAANNYGQRIRGYICPPATGNYIFWIASDDDSELWLSTNDNPVNKVRIASVTGLTTSRQWTKYASQQSASKNLIAGQKYYIEALHKEGTSNDNCAVGWQLPSGVQERPIPGSRLSPFIAAAPIPSIELVSAGSAWKYLDNGTNQGTAWKETSFNDAAWKTGNAELGYGDGAEATVVSYGSSSTNKYITTYFRKTFAVTDISTITGLDLSLIRDDGAAVYINGIEVYRNNLPTGTIYYNTLAPSAIDGTNESAFVLANISSSALVNGTNLIAVEIHQNARTSSDISFNLKLSNLNGAKILDNIAAVDSLQQNPVFENSYDMIVYPNPNTGQFSLELCVDDLKEKNLVIEVTDAFGKVVYKNQPIKINGCIKESIELKSNLPIGVYLMKVTIDDKIQTSKILLTK